ncbi:hypothetical protein LTR25_010722 [Vermiconidia calcicola]|uniref:Uncharacterized protein n=1 Tax=Vermiconidia calcicola TaxID=1690605 RepID=A0AAV9PRV0_9PEZI|nr:hypothetical protein LTR18_010647 [Exophiala xenobiotica]KAK5528056.1 hypothetical protein LTR25_010722 [Vermiconidia calcicola]
MMLLWACAGIPLGVYNIVEDFNVALKIQPQILTSLSLLTWIQCKYYGNKWPWTKSASIVAPVAAVMGGIECGLVFALRRAKHNHTEWPITLMAVLSACFLSAGVLRHYWDIYKERTVRGISFIFVAIDAMGDLTSLISVFFQPKLDILGMVIYGSDQPQTMAAAASEQASRYKRPEQYEKWKPPASGGVREKPVETLVVI